MDTVVSFCFFFYYLFATVQNYIFLSFLSLCTYKLPFKSERLTEFRNIDRYKRGNLLVCYQLNFICIVLIQNIIVTVFSVHHAMDTNRKVDAEFHAIITSELDGDGGKQALKSNPQ